MAKHTDDMRAVDQYSFAPIRLEPAHRKPGKPIANIHVLHTYANTRYGCDLNKAATFNRWLRRVELIPDPDILGRVL